MRTRYLGSIGRFCCGLWMLTAVMPAPAVADEAADWGALQVAEKQMGDRKSDPDVRLAAYQKFLADAKPGSVVSCVALFNIAEALRAQKKFDEAILTSRQAIATYSDQSAASLVVPALARSLRESGQIAEAATLHATVWRVLVAGGRSGNSFQVLQTSQTLQEIVRAQNDLIADATLPAARREDVRKAQRSLLQRVFVEIPIYLDDRMQGTGGFGEGWMQEALFANFDTGGASANEIAGWAKLYWMTSPFDPKAIERATRALSRAWTLNNDFAAVRAFAKTQEKPKTGEAPIAAQPPLLVANPLHRIVLAPLPQRNAQVLAERITYLNSLSGSERNRSLELVGIYLLQAALSSNGQVVNGRPQRTAAEKTALRSAMDHARKLLVERPEDADAIQQVCRVFKAADGSTRRADQFMAYLDGRAENPLNAFFIEMK